MRKLEQIFLLLLILFLPIQLGKHFWPPSAFVSGIRIDYLSPTLYLTDFLLVCVVGIFCFRLITEKKITPLLLCLFFVSLLCFIPFENILFWESFWYGYIRMVLYVILGFCIARHATARFLRLIAIGFIAPALLVVFLEGAQFLNQSSFQGIFYWFGERNFYLSSPGVARIVIDGHLLLRPYATFPHPNVLAFYLFIALLFVRYLMGQLQNNKQKTIGLVVFFVLFLGILITFSRLLIFCATLLMILDTLKLRYYAILLAIIAGVFLFLFYDRFLPHVLFVDFTDRLDHMLLLLNKQSSLWGWGLNQYFYYQIEVERSISPYFLQPPHNIAILILIQMGIWGLLFFFTALLASIKRILLYKNSYEKELKIILLITFIFASCFDHYFITLHQGMLLTAILFGIFWAKDA